MKNIIVRPNIRRWFWSSYYDLLFQNREDFEKALRFLQNIKHDLYETDYQWKFDVYFIEAKKIIQIYDKRGVGKGEGIRQCLELFKLNKFEVRLSEDAISEKTPILSLPPTPPITSI